MGSVRQAGKVVTPSLSDPRAVTPQLPQTLTMQLYSSSSISFTFRQYDCVGQEARLSEWLHLLDAHPDVPSATCTTAPRPPRGAALPSSWACGLRTGTGGHQGSWQQCFGAQECSPSRRLVAAQGRARVGEGGKGLRGSPPFPKLKSHGTLWGRVRGHAAGKTPDSHRARPARGSRSRRTRLLSAASSRDSAGPVTT